MKERMSLLNAFFIFLLVCAALLAVDGAMKLAKNVKFVHNPGDYGGYNKPPQAYNSPGAQQPAQQAQAAPVAVVTSADNGGYGMSM